MSTEFYEGMGKIGMAFLHRDTRATRALLGLARGHESPHPQWGDG